MYLTLLPSASRCPPSSSSPRPIWVFPPCARNIWSDTHRILALPGSARGFHQVSLQRVDSGRYLALTGPALATRTSPSAACSGPCGFGLQRTWYETRHGGFEQRTDSGVEIRQGQAVQTLQLHPGRVLPGGPLLFPSSSRPASANFCSVIGKSKTRPRPSSTPPILHLRVVP